MNSLYIGIGLTIIAVLVAALIGPYFIDWTAYRSVFEAEGRRVFGTEVTVLGQVQVRLLPMPSMTLDEVVVGPVQSPDMTIGRAAMKIELTPLLKGEIRVAELRLERPNARVGIDAAGRVHLPGIGAAADRGADLSGVGLDLAEITDGRLTVFDDRNGVAAQLEGLNATASAASLTGPIRVEGGANLDGRFVSFHLSTSQRRADGSWPARLQLSPNDAPYQLTVDGVFDPGQGRQTASGTISLQKLVVSEGKGDKFDAQPVPWQIDAGFAADTSRIGFDQIAVTVGQDERAYTITGKGEVTGGAKPNFDIQLIAKQIDLDRLMAAKVGEAADLGLAQQRLLSVLATAPVPPLSGRLRLDLAGVVLGGAAVQDVHLDVRTRTDGWSVEQFEARLPGRSRLSAAGRLTARERQGFDGTLVLASDQPASLMQWWRKGTAGRMEPFQLSTRAQISAGSLRLNELQARIGVSTARGALSWLAADDGTGRLKAALSADRLDLDQVRALGQLVFGDLAPGAGIVSGADLDIDAGQVLIGGEAIRGVAVKAAIDGDRVAIERLAVRDAAGAALTISGRIDKLLTAPDGVIEATVRAERLDGLVRLAEAVAPGSGWARRLTLAVPSLGPLSASAKLIGQATEAGGKLRLNVTGTAASSVLAIDAALDGAMSDWRRGGIDLSMRLEGADGGLVLRQLGLPVSSDGQTRGRIAVTARGDLASGLTLAASAEIGPTKLAADGQVTLPEDGTAIYSGDLKLMSLDLGPMATAFGQALPGGVGRLPAEVKAHLAGAGGVLTVSVLTGRVADVGTDFSGRLDLARMPALLSGDLRLTAADLTGLLELGLGAEAFAGPTGKSGPWSTVVLAGPMLTSVSVDLGLGIDQVTLDPAHRIDRFQARLNLRPSEVHFDSVSGALAGGKLTGALALRSGSERELSLSGNLQIVGAALADLVWRRDGRAVADGTLDLSATFETGGRTLAALAANLAGNGAMTATSGQLRYVDPEAFGAIIVAADNGLELKDEKIRSVFQGRLDAGTLPYDRIEAAFAMGGGVLRVKDVAVTSPRARSTGSVALDFGRWQMDADWTLKVDAGKNGVAGAEPQVGVIFRGALDQPVRFIDVSPLSAFLTLRAFEREVQRVEALQQDIMERDRFARELKRMKDEKLRQEQAAREAEEARRIRSEEDRRAAESAAVARAEEARRVEDARRQEELRQAEAARKAADQKRIDEAKKAAEDAARADAARVAAEKARAEAAARELEEAQRHAEEMRKAEEERRFEDLQRAEARRAEEEARARLRLGLDPARKVDEPSTTARTGSSELPALPPLIYIAPQPPVLSVPAQ